MSEVNKNKRKMPSLSATKIAKQRRCKASNVKPKKTTDAVARKKKETTTKRKQSIVPCVNLNYKMKKNK